MIVYFNSIDDYEFPITFEELKKRFPNTSFCVPLKQTAMPDGYRLCDEIIFEQNKLPNTKYTLDVKFLDDKVIAYEKSVEITEEEIESQKQKVDDLISEKIKEISWAFNDDTPERIRNKYDEYRKKLYDVYNQNGYPFHIDLPEI